MKTHLDVVQGNPTRAPIATHLLTDEIALLTRPIDQAHRFKFWGSGLALLGTVVINRFLTILTFGVYYFWGRAKVRRYLWDQIELNGDLFVFHGKGGELLLGWLKIRGILLPLTLLYLFATMAGKSASLFAGVFIFLVMTMLRPFAIVGSRRYLLSRTSWRGIRLSYRGSILRFVGLYYGGILLCLLTLGLYVPFFLNSTYRHLMCRTYFGSLRFHYDGKGRDLFPAYVKAFLLGFVTLGVAWFFFAAERIRYCIGHTSVGNLRLESTVNGGKLFRITISNVLLWLVTLGFATPWIIVRSLRFQFENTVLHGDLDAALSAVQQQKQRAGAMGDELADIGGMGDGLGI